MTDGRMDQRMDQRMEQRMGINRETGKIGDAGLLTELVGNRDKGAYPLHMPGHKRNTEKYQMDNPYGLDITEIDGFDDLHEPEGILEEGMQRAARVCGADESWYLVNGSTAGILAGIAACTRRGDRILMARGCHKSVYNAALLGGLKPVYLYPPTSGTFHLSGSIRPEDVETTLTADAPDESEGTVLFDSLPAMSQKEPSLLTHPRGRIALVVVTSPTYEGVISDIRGIAEVCHAHGVPLMVDEAHGAHLVLPGFPESAIACGADLVIQSLHKTLPAFTQTGLLHRCGNWVSGTRVKQFLDIYQSSSPSYLLMAGIDQCVRWMENEIRRGGSQENGTAAKNNPESSEAGENRRGKAGDCSKTREGCMENTEAGGLCYRPVDTAAWLDMLRDFYEVTSHCRMLRILDREPEFYDRDPSKLVISTGGSGHTGPELMDLLRQEYGFELEMASADYVIAMTGAGDQPEAIQRFGQAICEIDQRWNRERVEGEKPDTADSSWERVEGEKPDTADSSREREEGEKPDTADSSREREELQTSPKNPQEGNGMDIGWERWRAEPVLDLAEADRLKYDAERKCSMNRAYLGTEAQGCISLKALDTDALGCISLDFVYAYPPGIPLLAPGERVTKEVVHIADRLRAAGVRLRGTVTENEIRVLDPKDGENLNDIC